MEPFGRHEVPARSPAPRRRVALPAWWLLLALALPVAAHAQSGQVLRMGGDAGYPPYHFIDADGGADGFDVALARAVAHDLGMQPRFVLGEWDEALEALARGDTDIVPMFWSADRERRFRFTQPILIRHHVLFGPRSSPALQSLDELVDQRVAVQRASLAWEALREQAGPGVSLVELDTESATLHAVEAGQADYALAPTGIGYYAIQHYGIRDMIALSPPLLERRYVFAVHPDRADLVARIDASLDRLRERGVPHELYVRWIGNLSPGEPRLGAAWLVALLAAAVAGAALAWGWRYRRAAAFARNGSLDGDAGGHALLNDLRKAIDQDRLDYMLQPKLDLRSGRWAGAELLVRWEHPTHGPIEPDDFVQLAEQARVAGPMNLHLLRCGLEQRRRWPQADPPLNLSVNISANDLADPGLLEDILQAHREAGPGLMLEITETDAMREPERVAEALPQLRAQGILISLDDFGTGHSSLVNLRRLAPDELKIDRSFVTSLLSSRSDQAIVTATIAMAHELGATITAEGVEDEATRRWLAEAGCDMVQGFGIARPMPPADFITFLQQAP